MNKISFLKAFNDDDTNVLSNIYDKIILCEKKYIDIVINDFFTPNIWSKLLNIIPMNFDVNISAYGIFQDSERKMIAIHQDGISQFPVSLVAIENKSKFISLSHRDYLGALMSLGIKRERFGDLLVKGNVAYVAVSEEICNYIMLNLHTIGKSPCTVKKVDIDNLEAIPQYDYNEMIIQASSLRLDVIISGLCNVSRNESETLIRQGKVLVNYKNIGSKNHQVDYLDTLTVRGHGKFKILEEIGLTQKNRKKVKIKKYV